MIIKVAINGFGRIGKAALKVAWEKRNMQIAAINNPGDVATFAHLLKYDSVYGMWDHEVKGLAAETVVPGKPIGSLVIDGVKVPVWGEKDPLLLPWKRLKVDVVLECTGRFTKDDAAGAHLKAGAKRVIVSAPTKGGTTETFLLGVNAGRYAGQPLVSNASCTTNCIAPVMQIMSDAFGVKKAILTTVHAVTAEQNLVDSNPPALHPDLRRARSSLANIVPTTTGAASALGSVIPALRGIFDGLALRVPVLCGSLSDFTFLLKRNTTVAQVNGVFTKAARSERFQGVLAVTKEPIVSSDIIGRTESAIVDLSLTKVVDGDFVKVLAWYDNEWGYANRLVEMAVKVMGKK
ncbi:MAG: type I glyceraldehyde-3-phosphate dehydrogenase [Patescibacteria group bacterium]